MGFLLFLPFLLKAKGSSLTTVGLALSLIFIGGPFGKADCGWLGALARLVARTNSGLAAPLGGGAQRHVLGFVRHGPGTCYGATERAFALFYTGILGSSAPTRTLRAAW